MRLRITQSCRPVNAMNCLSVVVIERPWHFFIIKEIRAVSRIWALHGMRLNLMINLIYTRVSIKHTGTTGNDSGKFQLPIFVHCQRLLLQVNRNPPVPVNAFRSMGIHPNHTRFKRRNPFIGWNLIPGITLSFCEIVNWERVILAVSYPGPFSSETWACKTLNIIDCEPKVMIWRSIKFQALPAWPIPMWNCFHPSATAHAHESSSVNISTFGHANISGPSSGNRSQNRSPRHSIIQAGINRYRFAF